MACKNSHEANNTWNFDWQHVKKWAKTFVYVCPRRCYYLPVANKCSMIIIIYAVEQSHSNWFVSNELSLDTCCLHRLPPKTSIAVLAMCLYVPFLFESHSIPSCRFRCSCNTSSCYARINVYGNVWLKTIQMRGRESERNTE